MTVFGLKYLDEEQVCEKKKRKTLSCVLILKNNIFCFYFFDQNIFLNPNCSRTC